MNTISLQSLDKQLLERLSASQGNLLDDVALIGVLADTKSKAQEVKEKIEASVATEQIINKRREHYRPVATRGSVIYFVIVSMAQVNCMYQTSLAQFLQWFDGSLQAAEKANLVAKRVEILMKHLTYDVYLNINRGLFEKDKLTFKLMVTLKILLTEADGILDQSMVTLLLRGGSALTADQVPRKPFDWLQTSAWMNVCQLSTQVDFFGDLKSAVEQNEAEWRKWYEAEAPEEADVPRLEERLQTHPSGAFMRFLIVRSFRDDRTRLAANAFIGSVLGDRYTEPAATRLDDIWQVSDSQTPIILLLTPGADPTSQLEELAKKKGVRIYPVSMGEGQEPHALKSVNTGIEEGGWSVLQNCHLGLQFMAQLEDHLRKAHEGKVDPSFRLWITCEPHPDFPINLLQMSIKVTNEPPRGMKAGLLRSYSSVVDAERLARVETKEWRDLVFCVCFLHSTVQERRKFGPMGFSIPYEFNLSDLEASLTFLEKHSFSSNQGLSWPTIRYMICQVQYGGRITDDFDRILFDTFGKYWLSPDLFREDFMFSPPHNHFRYIVPQADGIEGYRKYLSEFPTHDSPEIFGLHVNADLTFGTNEALYILGTIADTQPKETSTKGGSKTREEIVYERADELLNLMPKGYKDEEVRDLIRKRSKLENEVVLGYKPEGVIDGFQIPLNVFLYQEVTRLNRTIMNVRNTLQDLKQAINGEIIMTPELQSALNSVYNEKPPIHWYQDASGQEIAWSLPSLALWFAGLLDRERQLSQWLTTTRPVTYWMTGFFNPQGFLTATRQEVTRRHKHEKWALDDVVLVTTVTEHTDLRRIRYPPAEGVYIHGLFLEGCSWDKKEGKLIESHPKDLYTPLPVIMVTAVTSKQAEKLYAPKEDLHYYDCPVYVQPKRTNRAYIFTVKLKTNVDPDHWVLRGVALLASKD